jgi:hypothetical protein
MSKLVKIIDKVLQGSYLTRIFSLWYVLVSLYKPSFGLI